MRGFLVPRHTLQLSILTAILKPNTRSTLPNVEPNLDNPRGNLLPKRLEISLYVPVCPTVHFLSFTTNPLLHFSGIGTRLSPCVFEEVVRASCTSITLRDKCGLAILTTFACARLPLEISTTFAVVPKDNPSRPRRTKLVSLVFGHNDLGKAVENSIIGLEWGVRQIEGSINGLGARKGNADLRQVILQLLKQGNYHIDIDTSLINTASKLVSEITGIPSPNQE